jgi:hypothetical protein
LHLTFLLLEAPVNTHLLQALKHSSVCLEGKTSGEFTCMHCTRSWTAQDEVLAQTLESTAAAVEESIATWKTIGSPIDLGRECE